MGKLCVELTKKDPAAMGQHHIINRELVGSVEGGRLMLAMPAAQAMQEGKALQSWARRPSGA